jgi:hypothetical protein
MSINGSLVRSMGSLSGPSTPPESVIPGRSTMQKRCLVGVGDEVKNLGFRVPSRTMWGKRNGVDNGCFGMSFESFNRINKMQTHYPAHIVFCEHLLAAGALH